MQELIKINNEETKDQLQDTLYIADNIFIPEKKDIKRCYRTNFTLKTQKETKRLSKEKKIVINPKYKDSDFFVYNERTNELVPFKKNDYLMYEHGYFTFDGINYLSYDDNGNEISKFSYSKDKEPSAKDILKTKKKNIVTKKKKSQKKP
ncbi:MAG: hypothetical protein WCL02_01400 [bacterium]